MRRYALVAIILLAGCASTGVIPTGADTFMVSKRSAQAGFGEPVGAIASVLKEANAFCAKRNATMEQVTLDKQNSGFAKPGSATLTFRCLSR